MRGAVSRAVSRAVDHAGDYRGVCVSRGNVEDDWDPLALRWALRPEAGADAILR